MRTSSEIYHGLIDTLIDQVRDAEYERDNAKSDLAFERDAMAAREAAAQRTNPSENDVAELLWKVGSPHYPDRKIQFIKDVRTLSGCGLKEAKDAVERVMGW